MATATSIIHPKLLAKSWAPSILQVEGDTTSSASPSVLAKAMERTIPLLQDEASVPFVCRYRSDVIHPLTNKQVHLLQSFVSKHDSLSSLRSKLLEKISEESTQERIQTTISKAELDDLWAPFKPPSKGSILERIENEHPHLVEAVDKLWSRDDRNVSLLGLSKKYPRDSLIHLLGGKIAAEPIISIKVSEELIKHCRIKTSKVISKRRAGKETNNDDDFTFQNYVDFSIPIKYIKDHQVLAIRRGVDKKAIKMAYDIDGTKMEGSIRYHLLKRDQDKSLAPGQLRNHEILLNEAIHDAWTRVLRRRGTSRLWNDKCKQAQEHACQVFQENLKRALLAPPRMPSQSILSLDPGYKAGIKCAILNSSGKVLKLETVKFLGGRREEATNLLVGLLKTTQEQEKKQPKAVLIALGNGHGSQDCRKLINEASEKCSIPIEVTLVNEAGASVWSVTEAALEEFPNQAAAAIASISIGRRVQNPLFELVKIPPRSLGLGMYQHDISEKELDERLHFTSVDAVATVGVDLNTSSLQILKKVPGLSKLADKVYKARPMERRKDLLKVSRLGAKTYENCAGFLRISNGPEQLDATLVHPESYDLAKWLLKTLSWNLESDSDSTRQTISQVPRRNWRSKWSSEIDQASKRFAIGQDRVHAVLENLADSILRKDPRLQDIDATADRSTSSDTAIGSIETCSLLSPELSETNALASAAPVRGVIGTIRNIADFGAFVDFGGPNDGLLHTSKLGPLKLSGLLIGQQIGVDVLHVDKKKVSLAVTGMNLQPDNRGANGSWNTKRNQPPGKSSAKRSMSASTSNRPSTKKRRRK